MTNAARTDSEHEDMPAAAAPPTRLHRLPSRLLNQNANRADRLASERLSAVGAHKWHYAVLSSLEESGPASQAELSRRTGIYRSDMVALLNELAQQDYVQRAPDPDDRRRNVVLITDAGRTRLDELARLIKQIEDELLAPFSPAERELLIDLLLRLNEHLETR
ncbi:MarR family winged helix-turn-helix transcriptional regulator [Actinospica durhamensis]|nr:MarR family transcriptional regulator [Actinospica durhamensis]